jgi:inorganic pyrophosphatase
MTHSSLHLTCTLCLGLGLAPLAAAADHAATTIQLPAKDLDKKFFLAVAPMNLDGTVNVVVEQPAAKGKKGRALPVGRIPHSILAKEKGGSGEPLTACLMGSSAPAGATVRGRVLGLMTRTLAGREDTRVVVVPMNGPFGPCATLEQLETAAPGFLAELKATIGPAKEAAFAPKGRKEALRFVGDAIQDFDCAYVTEARKRPLDKDGNPLTYRWAGARNIGE